MIRMLVEVRNSLQELQWILGFLCAEAREHFDFLNSSDRWCGAQGRGVLLQEFLEGTEYIVDHVSCDGVHKTTMLWMYDFQEVNGHRVCIAQRPVPCDFVCDGGACCLYAAVFKRLGCPERCNPY